MRALTLQEFAEDMRRNGDIRQADMADEILALIDLEAEVAEPYEELCDDLERAASEAKLDGKPRKQLEWLIDRSDLLKEIEQELDKDGRTGDTDDQVKALLSTLESARLIIGSPDGCSDETFLQELEALVERVPEETEIVTYDL